jgi:hypothetical protein
MNPPTERPIPPPWESEAILPPDIPDAWDQSASDSEAESCDRECKEGRHDEI